MTVEERDRIIDKIYTINKIFCLCTLNITHKFYVIPKLTNKKQINYKYFLQKNLQKLLTVVFKNYIILMHLAAVSKFR